MKLAVKRCPVHGIAFVTSTVSCTAVARLRVSALQDQLRVRVRSRCAKSGGVAVGESE
jgi:hypothetical protein